MKRRNATYVNGLSFIANKDRPIRMLGAQPLDLDPESIADYTTVQMLSTLTGVAAADIAVDVATLRARESGGRGMEL